MKPPPHEPYERGFDPESTDTLPLPVLPESDTGKPGALAPPLEAEPVRVRPRMRVPDAQDNDFTATDTFNAPRLMPIAARPVDALDLAETLRENEQQLRQALEKIGDLQAQLAQAQQRCRQLEEECGALREEAARAQAAPEAARVEAQPGAQGGSAADATPAPAPLQPADAAPSSVATDSSQRDLLRRQNERLHEALSSMQARIGVQEAMLIEAEEALETALRQRTAPAAGEPVHSPEQPAPDAGANAVRDAAGINAASVDTSGDAAAVPAVEEGGDAAVRRIDWHARFIELETVLEAERAAAAGRARQQDERLATLQSQLAALRNPAGARAAAGKAEQPLPTGTTLHVLVREEDGTEVVYPLGRHSTVGRTPDNDIQVNHTVVSRHHAVLLTGGEHCIIEDLNSTNGIVVNGLRVTRQLLHDGDVVTIGNTHFRYETRP